jgi:hypothetical protein
MSWILKLLSVKAERETGEWLVSSPPDIGAIEGAEHRAKLDSEDVQRRTFDKQAAAAPLRRE